jgi:hypothetical protein
MKTLRTNCKEPTDYLRSNTVITTELLSGQKPFQRPKKMASSSVPSLGTVWWMLKRLLHCQGIQSAPHIDALISALLSTPISQADSSLQMFRLKLCSHILYLTHASTFCSSLVCSPQFRAKSIGHEDHYELSSIKLFLPFSSVHRSE